MTETKARAACLIGWPAAHSRSPLIHHHWLRTLGIEGGYVIEAVPPDELQDFVLRLSAHGFVGANITIPHKECALALTKPDARACAVGAANTLWYEGRELRSTNTDIEGFINNLDARASGWDATEEALVLGAGGSSRAVVFGLIERSIKRIHLANRIVIVFTLASTFDVVAAPHGATCGSRCMLRNAVAAVTGRCGARHSIHGRVWSFAAQNQLSQSSRSNG